MILLVSPPTVNTLNYFPMLTKLKVETAWTVSTHSVSAHATHPMMTTHPEHAWAAEKGLEDLVGIHICLK